MNGEPNGRAVLEEGAIIPDRRMTAPARALRPTIGLMVAIVAVGAVLVYLEVWSRVVTALEDRDLLEPASSPQEPAECKPGRSD